jgi:cytoskeleton protein RodZ
MSDLQVKAAEKAATAAPRPERQALPDSGDGSFGRALAAAREARGLSQADVAAQLRLHPKQVQAIEAEDLEALPEGPFVRGYVRNYARLVDLPAEPLLALLNARLKPTDPLPAPAGSPAVSPIQRTAGEPISGRIVIAAVVVVLALLAAFGWWATREKAPAAVPAGAPAPGAGAAAPAAPANAPAAAEAAPSGDNAVLPAAAAAGAATAPAGPATGPAEAASPGAAAAAAPAAAPTALRFTFRDRSWVEVRQADGTLLTSQNNAAGTTRTVEGRPPYLIVIGNASKVDLEFRGERVDLAPAISRDDVARLRLE